MNQQPKNRIFIISLLLFVLVAVGIVNAQENPAANTTTSTTAPEGYLTGPQTGDALDIALNYLRANKETYGLTEADLADVRVSDRYVSQHTGVTHIYLVQRLNGVEVFNGLININVMQDGRILFIGNRFYPDLANAVKDTTPAISAIDAVQTAASHLNLAITEPLTTLSAANTPDQTTLLSKGGISQNDIEVKLVYDTSGKAPQLAWNAIIYQNDSLHWWNIRVDANTGEIISQNDWVVSEHWGTSETAETHAASTESHTGEQVTFSPTPVADGSSYQVYQIPIESPIHSSPPSPADGRTVQAQPADAVGSPFGWHDTNGAVGAESTLTIGNNVQAYLDLSNDNTPSIPGDFPADGGAGLDFLFPLDLTQAPSTYRPAAVTNLFYWNNLMHDVPYRYGFDAVAGNFQENNYGLGGLGSDSVNAEAQDGGGTNNANFATPADGNNPRMQMYLWNLTTPGRDGDLDNGIITHEYGHGISNRLVGGPSNVNCLNNAEQMGEGWSDWQSVMLTMRTGDTATTNRGVGTYALGQATNGVGIRPAPYNTNMAVNGYTYGDLPSMAVPHGVGFVWNTMLWEVNWALINEYGFNEDMYRPVGGSWTALSGNQLAYQLVSDGMKLAVCSPGFVDGRDAILAADQALTGGTNQCTIWAAFAKRGLGFSASQGSSSSTSDGTEAFDVPPACLTLDVTPTTQNICQGQTATYAVGVGTSFIAPVAMSATGNPAPTTATFTPNPVNTVPSSTDLTIGNTAGAAAGNYTITITGNDGATSDSIDVGLNIYAGSPTAPTLLTPANGTTGVSLTPSLTWSAVANATGYHVQVATDAGFSNIVYESDEPTTSHTAGSLSANTTYYWRVVAMNACGTGTYSAPFSFTTAGVYCSTPALPLPDDPDQSTNMVIVDTGQLLDLDLSINANHTWVGDTIFTLVHQGTGTSVTVIDRPGRTTTGFGCANDNIDVLLDDEGADGPVENQCATNPALFGSPTPNNLLAAFDGEDLSGTWTLQYSDAAGGDTGTLNEWCLVPSIDTVTYSIVITKTVGIDPNVCATTDSITLPPGGGDVTYCYLVTNTGDGVLNSHDLVDDQLGTILNNFAYVLNPGASAYLTVTTTIVTNTVNVATWTADDGTNSATDTDSATVFVQHYLPDIETDASISSTQATDTVVTQTLQITNAGEVTGTIALAGGGGSDLVWNIQENGGTAVSSLITGNSVVVGGCAGDIPWLSVTPTAGTTALFNTSDVSVVFDSTGMTAGTYASELCVVSNDLDEPVVTVPVTLSVTAPTYGVVLSGDEATSGDVGTTVTYTLQITNTGEVADTFDLSVSGNSWATVLSDSSMALNAGETASFTASVSIPGGASNGDMDTATVTATSQSDGSVADSADLTTTAVFNAVYGVELSANDAASGLVGTTVTYTVHITNTGNGSDTFDLTIGGNGWTTTLSAGSATLNAGENRTFTAVVDIPGGAANGDTDTVTVTATSQSDGAATDSADLTTTAVLSEVYGVELSADDAASGDAGTTVTYTLHLTNTGNVADTFDVTINGNGWSTAPSDASITLNAGANGSFTVVVEVPAGANNGDTDTVTITVTSQTDGAATDSADLTTTAVAPLPTAYTAYLPFVTKP